jgi:hypothetical protein
MSDMPREGKNRADAMHPTPPSVDVGIFAGCWHEEDFTEAAVVDR